VAVLALFLPPTAVARPVHCAVDEIIRVAARRSRGRSGGGCGGGSSSAGFPVRSAVDGVRVRAVCSSTAAAGGSGGDAAATVITRR
jgi:hypothetical protein